MKIMTALLTISVSMSGTIYADDPTSEKIKSCVANRLTELKLSSSRPRTLSITEGCPPGHNETFKGCVGIENKDTSFSMPANAGWQLVPGTGSVVRTGGDTPTRSGVSLVSQDSNAVVGRAWCNGHGCGGEGKINVSGEIRASEQRIPTEIDRNEALDACLTEMLPK
jgi:hypothetical protein